MIIIIMVMMLHIMNIIKQLWFVVKETSVYMFSGTTGNIVVCVSSLTSLMLDQHSKFVPHGLQAEFVGEI